MKEERICRSSRSRPGSSGSRERRMYMYRDWKMRRAAGEKVRLRNFREEKNADGESLARFRQKPYALVYEEKLRELKGKGRMEQTKKAGENENRVN